MLLKIKQARADEKQVIWKILNMTEVIHSPYQWKDIHLIKWPLILFSGADRATEREVAKLKFIWCNYVKRLLIKHHIVNLIWKRISMKFDISLL